MKTIAISDWQEKLSDCDCYSNIKACKAL